MDALQNLSDAIDVTRNFLTPVRKWLWLKLALVVFFIGSGGGGLSFPTSDPTAFTTDIEDGPATDFDIDVGTAPADLLTGEVVTAILIIAAIVAALVVFFGILAAILEFVFIESLRSSEVHLRQYFKGNFGNGVRLFGFRILLNLGLFAVVAGPILYLVFAAESYEAVPIGTILAIGVLGVVLYLPYILVLKLTTEFVVPTMLQTNRGVLGGWKRFGATFSGSWGEYIVYVILSVIAGFVASLAVGVLTLFVMAIIGIVLGLFVLVAWIISETLGFIVLAVVALLFVILYIVLAALFQVPVLSYLRYYALLQLGDTDADLDLVPDQRAAVRADGGSLDGDGPGGVDTGTTGGDAPSSQQDDQTDELDSSGWDFGSDSDSDSDSDSGSSSWDTETDSHAGDDDEPRR